jgi:hypothetical protein
MRSEKLLTVFYMNDTRSPIINPNTKIAQMIVAMILVLFLFFLLKSIIALPLFVKANSLL